MPRVALAWLLVTAISLSCTSELHVEKELGHATCAFQETTDMLFVFSHDVIGDWQKVRFEADSPIESCVAWLRDAPDRLTATADNPLGNRLQVFASYSCIATRLSSLQQGSLVFYRYPGSCGYRSLQSTYDLVNPIFLSKI